MHPNYFAMLILGGHMGVQFYSSLIALVLWILAIVCYFVFGIPLPDLIARRGGLLRLVLILFFLPFLALVFALAFVLDILINAFGLSYFFPEVRRKRREAERAADARRAERFAALDAEREAERAARRAKRSSRV